MDQRELGAFLRSQRERLRPDDVGLVGGGRRRTPGLRRDEVALLANLSADYYERIEQGRGPRPSSAALTALARALRLTPDQRDYIFLLAGQAPPVARLAPEPDSGLMLTLDALAGTVPALIADSLFNILAQNPLNVAVFGSLATAGGRRSNFLWRWFTDPRWRSVYVADQHEHLGTYYVSDLRAAVARRGADRDALDLVDALNHASAEFRRIWARHEVAVKKSTLKVVDHPMVGRLALRCASVLNSPTEQRIVLCRPEPGTDTADRMATLMLREGVPRAE